MVDSVGMNYTPEGEVAKPWPRVEPFRNITVWTGQLAARRNNLRADTSLTFATMFSRAAASRFWRVIASGLVGIATTGKSRQCDFSFLIVQPVEQSEIA